MMVLFVAGGSAVLFLFTGELGGAIFAGLLAWGGYWLMMRMYQPG